MVCVYEYKVDGTQSQYQAIEEAIRTTQFVRNKCLRLWMDTRGTNRNDLQCYCAQLAKTYAFAEALNSQARQSAADRAWAAISRFYDNCRHQHFCHIPYCRADRNGSISGWRQRFWTATLYQFSAQAENGQGG